MQSLTRQAIQGLTFLLAVMAVCLMVSAGTLDYWQAWMFLAVFGGCTLAITLYLMRYDPALLERRVNAGPGAEQQRTQQVIQGVASLAFISILIVPGLDRRYGWSQVPVPATWLADVFVVMGFVIVFRVFRANSFTSATIEVAAEQRVITSGPYGIVRHPMYAGAFILIVAMPVALASWVAEIPSVLLILAIVVRLLDEERFLTGHLAGYAEYRQQVRYRLVPGVW